MHKIINLRKKNFIIQKGCDTLFRNYNCELLWARLIELLSINFWQWMNFIAADVPMSPFYPIRRFWFTPPKREPNSCAMPWAPAGPATNLMQNCCCCHRRRTSSMPGEVLATASTDPVQGHSTVAIVSSSRESSMTTDAGKRCRTRAKAEASVKANVAGATRCRTLNTTFKHKALLGRNSTSTKSFYPDSTLFHWFIAAFYRSPL